MPTVKKIASIALFSLLLTVCLVASAKADTTYTYTGPPFTFSFGGVCPPICSITGSFTLPTPLAANDDMVPLPSSVPFSFSSGPYTANQTNSVGQIMISTNAAGVIDDWDVNLTVYSGYMEGFYIDTSKGPSIASYDQFAEFVPNPGSGGEMTTFGADNENTPIPFGTWTVSTTTVPEPSTVLMLGVVLLGLARLTLKKL